MDVRSIWRNYRGPFSIIVEGYNRLSSIVSHREPNVTDHSREWPKALEDRAARPKIPENNRNTIGSPFRAYREKNRDINFYPSRSKQQTFNFCRETISLRPITDQPIYIYIFWMDLTITFTRIIPFPDTGRRESYLSPHALLACPARARAQ